MRPVPGERAGITKGKPVEPSFFDGWKAQQIMLPMRMAAGSQFPERLADRLLPGPRRTVASTDPGEPFSDVSVTDHDAELCGPPV